MTIDEMRKKATELVFGQFDTPDSLGKFWNATSIVKGSLVEYRFEYNGVVISFTHDTHTGKYSISDNRDYFFYFRNDNDSCNDCDYYIHFGIDGCEDTEYCGNIIFHKYNIGNDFDEVAENMYEAPKRFPDKKSVENFLIANGIRYESKYDYESD